MLPLTPQRSRARRGAMLTGLFPLLLTTLAVMLAGLPDPAVGQRSHMMVNVEDTAAAGMYGCFGDGGCVESRAIAGREWVRNKMVLFFLQIDLRAVQAFKPSGGWQPRRRP